MHPRERDFSDFKNYETFNAATNMMDQNFPFNYHFLSNPYWIMNKQPKEDKIRRAISSLNLSYEISDKLSFQARASYDFSNKSYEQQHAAGSNPTNTGSNGRWDYAQFTDELFYSDAIFTYNNDFSDDLTFNAVLGASLQKTTFGNTSNFANRICVANTEALGMKIGDVKNRFQWGMSFVLQLPPKTMHGGARL